jgi:hypothetical protein
MKKILVTMMALATVCFFTCKKKETTAMAGPSMMVNTSSPSHVSDTIGKGTFTSYDHGLGGNAILYKDSSGNKTLQLYNFNMTAGPDVHLYLSTTSSYSSSNIIELSHFTTGYNNSSINFPVTSTSYGSNYKYVLVYCVQYSSLFGYAELK